MHSNPRSALVVPLVAAVVGVVTEFRMVRLPGPSADLDEVDW